MRHRLTRTRLTNSNTRSNMLNVRTTIERVNNSARVFNLFNNTLRRRIRLNFASIILNNSRVNLIVRNDRLLNDMRLRGSIANKNLLKNRGRAISRVNVNRLGNGLLPRALKVVCYRVSVLHNIRTAVNRLKTTANLNNNSTTVNVRAGIDQRVNKSDHRRKRFARVNKLKFQLKIKLRGALTNNRCHRLLRTGLTNTNPSFKVFHLINNNIKSVNNGTRVLYLLNNTLRRRIRLIKNGTILLHRRVNIIVRNIRVNKNVRLRPCIANKNVLQNGVRALCVIEYARIGNRIFPRDLKTISNLVRRLTANFRKTINRRNGNAETINMLNDNNILNKIRTNIRHHTNKRSRTKRHVLTLITDLPHALFVGYWFARARLPAPIDSIKVFNNVNDTNKII